MCASGSTAASFFVVSTVRAHSIRSEEDFASDLDILCTTVLDFTEGNGGFHIRFKCTQCTPVATTLEFILIKICVVIEVRERGGREERGGSQAHSNGRRTMHTHPRNDRWH